MGRVRVCCAPARKQPSSQQTVLSLWVEPSPPAWAPRSPGRWPDRPLLAWQPASSPRPSRGEDERVIRWARGPLEVGERRRGARHRGVTLLAAAQGTLRPDLTVGEGQAAAQPPPPRAKRVTTPEAAPLIVFKATKPPGPRPRPPPRPTRPARGRSRLWGTRVTGTLEPTREVSRAASAGGQGDPSPDGKRGERGGAPRQAAGSWGPSPHPTPDLQGPAPPPETTAQWRFSCF